MKLKYVGVLGTLDLNDSDIVLLEGHNLYDYNYTIESRTKNGGIGELFNRVLLPAKVLNFSLLVKKEKLDNLRLTFETDINQNNVARLYIGEAYVECYIHESSQKKHYKYSDSEVLYFKATVLTPLWITEIVNDYSIYAPNTGTKGFKIPMSFPTRFVNDDKLPILNNETGDGTLSEIIFYGPVVNPFIVINNHRYGVEGTLLDDERYVINQMNKTVTKITSSGDIINSFHLRQKTPSVFTPISKGLHPIVFSGIFSIRITLFKGSVNP